MECKGASCITLSFSFCDLIETLWNVKTVFHTSPAESTVDLIETLWNVKDILIPEIFVNQARFNRDIVECKVKIA